MFALHPVRPESRRFALCRALCEVLLRPAGEPALVSKHSHSEAQRRNRAFAAEFLAPAETIRERLGSAGLVAQSDCEELGGKLGVLSLVIRHQIENHRIAPLLAA